VAVTHVSNCKTTGSSEKRIEIRKAGRFLILEVKEIEYSASQSYSFKPGFRRRGGRGLNAGEVLGVSGEMREEYPQ